MKKFICSIGFNDNLIKDTLSYLEVDDVITIKMFRDQLEPVLKNDEITLAKKECITTNEKYLFSYDEKKLIKSAIKLRKL